MSRMGSALSPTDNLRRRSSTMANAKRASMREGPLAALFRKTEGEEESAEQSEPGRQRQGQAAEEAGIGSGAARHLRESGLPHPALGAESTDEEATRVPTPRERLRHAFSSEIPEN